jgi:hypothetical protein
MKMVDHARLVQALQDTSVLVACHLDPEKHTVATKTLQNSIALLLGELKQDWCELVPQTAEPSVGVPD